MIRNKALDFIIEKIQWGEIKAGSPFYSEKELAIKLNISRSTAKNALNFAESINLLKSKRGAHRIVEDFTENVFLRKYLKINAKDINIIKTTKYDDYDKSVFNKYFKYKIFFLLKIQFKWNNKIIANFYSSTKNKSLYQSFLNDSGSFLNFLKVNHIIIEKIKEIIFFDNKTIFVRRLLFDRKNQLLEEGVFVIQPEYFLRKKIVHFFYSSNQS